MSRPHHDVAIPALALRRTEAAAALSVSIETFDQHIRAQLPVLQIGGVITYPVAAIQQYINDHQGLIADDLLPPRHRRAA